MGNRSGATQPQPAFATGTLGSLLEAANAELRARRDAEELLAAQQAAQVVPDDDETTSAPRPDDGRPQQGEAGEKILPSSSVQKKKKATKPRYELFDDAIFPPDHPPDQAFGRRRDFCDNAVVDRGIALRRNLGLPDPRTASTLIHGLAPSVTYHFTVSCVAMVDGELRESPPSLASKPLEIPNVDDDDWHTSEIIDKVLSYGGAVSSSTVVSGASSALFGGSSASQRAHYAAGAPARRPAVRAEHDHPLASPSYAPRQQQLAAASSGPAVDGAAHGGPRRRGLQHRALPVVDAAHPPGRIKQPESDVGGGGHALLLPGSSSSSSSTTPPRLRNGPNGGTSSSSGPPLATEPWGSGAPPPPPPPRSSHADGPPAPALRDLYRAPPPGAERRLSGATDDSGPTGSPSLDALARPTQTSPFEGGATGRGANGRGALAGAVFGGTNPHHHPPGGATGGPVGLGALGGGDFLGDNEGSVAGGQEDCVVS